MVPVIQGGKIWGKIDYWYRVYERPFKLAIETVCGDFDLNTVLNSARRKMPSFSFSLSRKKNIGVGADSLAVGKRVSFFTTMSWDNLELPATP